jgi:alpha-galactosidase
MNGESEVSSVTFRHDPPQATYSSGLTTYVEELASGRWVPRSWTAGGGISHVYGYEHMPPAFHLEADGQTLDFGWELAEMKETDPGRAVVRLKSSIRPVEVELHTELDGTGFIERWLVIRNTGSMPIPVNHLAPVSGQVMTIEPLGIGMGARLRSWRDRTSKRYPFTLGYFADQKWDLEGSFTWMSIPTTPIRIESRMGMSGHGSPFFIVRNEAKNEHLVAAIEWSGNWSAEFLLDDRATESSEAGQGECARLCFKAGPDNPYWVGGPLRVLAPGESAESPKVHVGLFAADFDGVVQAWHRHLRKSVLREPNLTVTAGIGIVTDQTTPESLKERIDRAASVGAQVVTVDAGWYAAKGSHWFPTVGDYDDDAKRLPGGLAPVFEYARKKGLKCGLWFDLERIGRESEIYKQHPEWMVNRYGNETSRGDVDLSIPEAAAWMEEQLVKVIERYKLDLFRLDYNGGFAGGQVARAGYMENTAWRYYEVIYAMYDRIRKRFPNLIMENCASGGGRTDAAMMKRFHFTWVSDEHQPPRCTRLLNGMSIALPPERLDAVAMGRDVDFPARHDLLSHMAVSGLALDLPEAREKVKRYVEFYKNFVSPWLPDSLVYHHTPELPGEPGEPKGWCVLEYVSPDRTRALVALFRLADAGSDYTLRLRGVDRAKSYTVTFDNSGDSEQIPGGRLINQGLVIRLEQPQSSELLVLEAK